MLDVTSRVNASIAGVHERCSRSEYEAYRVAAAKILTEILLEVLNPIYSAHPALRPPGLEV
jgi:hypothetical protein